ncbi:MAG: TIGR01212 family radical SAM protein [Candidatus Delongbacteria bacterium]|nr:TIGR01212 family radical SAM protein [Candidatus Delongbacteria bacterium]MBN2835575.1 TIGR01212 family radical SAM protein [Candidatus Delongbacteria bacterium]
MNDKKYYDFSTFLKENYPFKKVGKIGVTLNTPCPNDPPCKFCNSSSFVPYSIKGIKSIREQIINSIPFLSKKYKTNDFIAYFQDNTSTYGDPQFLEKSFSEACSIKDIKILNLSTRPDYINEDILEIINKGSLGKPVWLELGLQSFSDKTLKDINRGHDTSCFLKAYNLIRKRTNFKVGFHVILGLQGEKMSDFIYTAQKINDLRPDYIKISHLQIVSGSEYEKEYRLGKITVFSKEEYLEVLTEFIANLHKNISIHRIVGSAHSKELIAPVWGTLKESFVEALKNYMLDKNLSQGCRLEDI